MAPVKLRAGARDDQPGVPTSLMMDNRNMSDRLAEVEAMLKTLASLHIDAEMRAEQWKARDEQWKEEWRQRQRESDERMERSRAQADREMKRLRNVLLSAIRIGRRDRTRMNTLIDSLTASQLRLEGMIQRHDARFKSLENPN